MGNVICFMNNKGGVAKTMSAFNVGILWAKIGKKVLFIDLDSQANLTGMLAANDPRYADSKWENTIEDAFVIGPKLNPLPILPSRYEGVDFVPADLKLSNFDVDTSTISLKVYLLKDLIAPVKNNYDYIIIDCPPALGGIILNAMVASDGLVLVTTPDQPSLDGMHMVINVYNEIINDERLNPYLKFLVCLADWVVEAVCEHIRSVLPFQPDARLQLLRQPVAHGWSDCEGVSLWKAGIVSLHPVTTIAVVITAKAQRARQRNLSLRHKCRTHHSQS